MELTRKPKPPSWLPSTTIQMGLAVSQERWKIYLKLAKNNTPDDDDNTT
jgi:hypothetical protein